MLGVLDKITQHNKHQPDTLLFYLCSLNIMSFCPKKYKITIFGTISYYWRADKPSGLMVCPHNLSASQRLWLGINKLIFHPSDIMREFHGNRGDIILLRGLSLNTQAYESATVCVGLCVCEGHNGCQCGNPNLPDALQRLPTNNWPESISQLKEKKDLNEADKAKKKNIVYTEEC